MNEKKKVTGVGGIFFKTKDAAKLKEWYSHHLGIKMNDYGASFKSRQWDHPDQSAYLQWSPFSEDTDYFAPSDKPFMINYRVHDLEALVMELRSGGVTICDEISTHDYGKFVHILDLEGNKIELWEPVDSVFDKWHIEKDQEGVNH